MQPQTLQRRTDMPSALLERGNDLKNPTDATR